MLVAAVSALAYEPMLVEGRVWEYAMEDPLTPGELTYHSLRCGGKVKLRGDQRSDKFAKNCVCILNHETNDTLAYVRELDGAVYIVDSGGSPNPYTSDLHMYLNHGISMETLYDLLLDAGDSYYEYLVITPGGLGYCGYSSGCYEDHETYLNKIESTDSITVGGKKVKRQTVYINNDGIMRRYHIAEGLGITDRGDFINVYRSPEADEDSREMYLSKVTDPDGRVIYEYEKPRTNLIRNDRIWKYTRSNLSYTYPQCQTDYYCRFDGTEEVNGKTYARFCRYMTEHRVEWAPDSVSKSVYDTESHLMALLREENGKVYLLPASVRNDISFPESEFFPSGNRVRGCGEREAEVEEADYGSLPESVVYDFSAGEGESWEYCPDGSEHYTMEVTGSRIIRIRRENSRQLTVSLKETFDTGLRFVEGIGNIGEGNMTGYRPEPEVDCDNGYERLEAVYNDDESLLYIAPKEASIVNSGNTWEYGAVESYKTDHKTGGSLNKTAFRGTVEIGGKTYHRFVAVNRIWWQYQYGEMTIFPTETTEEQRIGLLREEDGALYVRAYNDSDGYGTVLVSDDDTPGEYDLLLCDFDAAVGTKFLGVGSVIIGTNSGHLIDGGYVDCVEYIISEAGYTNVNGRELKYIVVSTTGEYSRIIDTYIESIGPVNSVLTRPIIDESMGMNLQYEFLNGVYDSAGNKIFGDWTFDVPKADGIAGIEADDSSIRYEGHTVTATMSGDLTLEIFNSSGIQVASVRGIDCISFPTESLSRGIYVAKVRNDRNAKSLKFMVI